jgi:transposase
MIDLRKHSVERKNASRTDLALASPVYAVIEKILRHLKLPIDSAIPCTRACARLPPRS